MGKDNTQNIIILAIIGIGAYFAYTVYKDVKGIPGAIGGAISGAGSAISGAGSAPIIEGYPFNWWDALFPPLAALKGVNILLGKKTTTAPAATLKTTDKYAPVYNYNAPGVKRVIGPTKIISQLGPTPIPTPIKYIGSTPQQGPIGPGGKPIFSFTASKTLSSTPKDNRGWGVRI